MKNIFLAICLLFACATYAQEISTKSVLADQIEMPTTEVGPSGLLQFSFDEATIVTYRVYAQTSEVISNELQVNQGLDARKIDLSSLASGVYTINFYIDEVEVKQVQFTKL